MAVYANSSGLIAPLNISSQASVDSMVGYAYVRVPASTAGPIATGGRLKLYSNPNNWALGTPLYIGVDGNPTNIVPSVGVNGFTSGMYCIFLGVLIANEAAPSEFEIALFTQIVGVL